MSDLNNRGKKPTDEDIYIRIESKIGKGKSFIINHILNTLPQEFYGHYTKYVSLPDIFIEEIITNEP